MTQVFSALLCALLVLGPVAPAEGQTATVRTEENFRLEPNGTVLARVQPGTVLAVEGSDGRWVNATLEGWVWTPSLEALDRDDFDLVVSAEGGENLRVEPQGTILARLREGTLLEEVERGDGWIRVRRTAWIWEPSVRESGEAPAAAGDPGPDEPGSLASGWRTVGSSGSAILGAPDGDTLARVPSGVELRVLGRRGSWARVRMEGWAWLPGGEEPSPAADSTVLTDLTPEDVASEPARYRGRVVAWELQFISREEAEPIRTDFYEGEPYLLTRHAGRSSSFVYVAVPPERLDDLGELRPLERISVVGRIRAGSAALTGGPILDLLELSRSDGSGADP